MTFKFLAWSVHLRTPIKQTESPCSSSKPGRGETRLLHFLGVEVSTVPNQASARALEPDIVNRLARFFPDATPVRIPIKLSRARSTSTEDHHNNGNGNGNADNSADAPIHDQKDMVLQDTVIEFGTPHEVLFAVNCPLEFADRVLVESKDGTLHAEASVVAVQYHPERTVVAVRFLKHVPNWIVKS